MDKLEFKAVVLDLFDTLVTWNPALLPEMEWKGRQIHTTLPWIFDAAESALGDRFRREEFVKVYLATYEEIHTERNRELIEITCTQRFQRTLARLGLGDNRDVPAIAERLARVHMRGVRGVTQAPQARVEAVKRIARRYRLGLISNFDDSQAGHEIMHDTGVRDLFDAIIISADAGLRKPNPLIFQKIMRMMRLEPRDILFVGDTPLDDVTGAKQVGMHSAWIRSADKSIAAGAPLPDIIVDDLADLPDAIGC